MMEGYGTDEDVSVVATHFVVDTEDSVTFQHSGYRKADNPLVVVQENHARACSSEQCRSNDLLPSQSADDKVRPFVTIRHLNVAEQNGSKSIDIRGKFPTACLGEDTNEKQDASYDLNVFHVDDVNR